MLHCWCAEATTVVAVDFFNFGRKQAFWDSPKLLGYLHPGKLCCQKHNPTFEHCKCKCPDVQLLPMILCESACCPVNKLLLSNADVYSGLIKKPLGGLTTRVMGQHHQCKLLPKTT